MRLNKLQGERSPLDKLPGLCDILNKTRSAGSRSSKVGSNPEAVPVRWGIHLVRLILRCTELSWSGAREIVEVPEDSPDAKKWPLYHGQDTETDCERFSAASLSLPGQPDSSSLLNPLPKKSGPRKPKKTLGPLPSASNQKAKKLTTLDKSLMDWKAHTGDSALRDELDANRKAGGYLEKVEFLKRVDERKEENLDHMQNKKRRKLWRLRWSTSWMPPTMNVVSLPICYSFFRERATLSWKNIPRLV